MAEVRLLSLINRDLTDTVSLLREDVHIADISTDLVVTIFKSINIVKTECSINVISIIYADLKERFQEGSSNNKCG